MKINSPENIAILKQWETVENGWDGLMTIEQREARDRQSLAKAKKVSKRRVSRISQKDIEALKHWETQEMGIVCHWRKPVKSTKTKLTAQDIRVMRSSFILNDACRSLEKDFHNW